VSKSTEHVNPSPEGESYHAARADAGSLKLPLIRHSSDCSAADLCGVLWLGEKVQIVQQVR
jgi:hypothetical protein